MGKCLCRAWETSLSIVIVWCVANQVVFKTSLPLRIKSQLQLCGYWKMCAELCGVISVCSRAEAVSCFPLCWVLMLMEEISSPIFTELPHARNVFSSISCCRPDGWPAWRNEFFLLSLSCLYSSLDVAPGSCVGAAHGDSWQLAHGSKCIPRKWCI